MRRILVTGATGFVGRATLQPLTKRGYEVHILGRTFLKQPGVVFHQADIFDPAAVERAIKSAGASHLLHLAWSVPPGRFWHSPDNLNWVAVSLNLFRCFAEAGGRRALAVGTCAEYTWDGLGPLTEGVTPYAPASLYGIAKDALRRILFGYAGTCGLSLAWAHLFFMYGPGEAPGRLVRDAVEALLAGHTFPTSEGSQRRDFMHVDDVGAALAALIDSRVEGPVNVGLGQAMPIRSILEELGRQTGQPNLFIFGARTLSPTEPALIQADTARLFGEVAFRPRYDLASGLAQTLALHRGI